MMKKVREELYEDLNESSATNKKGFHDNLEQDTLDNDNFRKVLYTAKNMQLVLMTLKPGENIGTEHHPPDQFFRFESGSGECIINDHTYKVKDGDSIIVPGGAEHDVINTGKVALHLYTIYGPPNHTDKVIHKTKEQAEKAEKSGEDKFRGDTTE
jgi:mannose-6-phosphate isomerase-like protein (cupin superfamily)